MKRLQDAHCTVSCLSCHRWPRRSENRKPGYLTRKLVILCNPLRPPGSLLAALCPVMSFSGGSRGLVTALKSRRDWSRRSAAVLPLPPLPASRRRRHSDQLLELHNNNKRGSSLGRKRSEGAEKRNDTVTPDVHTIKEHFYILFLLRRITKIFFLSENNASTSVFEGL